VDFQAVARISTQAELKAVRLKFLHADMIEDGPPIPAEWVRSVLSGFSAEPRLDPDSKQLTIECAFLAVYAPGVDPATVGVLPNPKDAPVEIHARFELTYALSDVEILQEEDPKHFAISNGILHAWPYWREVAQSTTTRMGLTPMTVGTLKIPWAGDPKDQADREGTPSDPD
jgi:hypothetical protein